MTAPHSPRRLLVRGVNWLGDAVMTTPALLALRTAFPDARVTLLTPTKLADLWPGHPAIDEIATFGPDESPWRVGRRLRGLDFDTALVLPNSPRSAIEVWLAGVPRRVGFSRPFRNWWLTERVPPRSQARRMRKPNRSEIDARLAGRRPARAGLPPFGAHHTLDYLRLVEALGVRATPDSHAPHLAVDTGEIAAAREKFGLTPTATWMGLNPGAEYGPAKRWPAERFAEVARRAAETRGIRWMIFGGPGDRDLADDIARRLPESANLAGRTTLRELMAVMTLCRLVLTNDTGPMHVAAALGIPVVVPFGSTSPELTGPGIPGDPRHRLILADAACAPCFLRRCPIDFRCMDGIGVERVLAEVLAVAAVGRA